MVPKAISKMKSGQVAGPSGIIIEMIKAVIDGVTVCLTPLFNHIIYIDSNKWLTYIIKQQSFQKKRRCFISWKLQRSWIAGTCDENCGAYPQYDYLGTSLSITCILVSCHVEVPLMQFSYLESYKKSICKRRKISTLNLSTKRRLLIVYFIKFIGR